MRSSISSSDPYSYEDRPIPANGWAKALLLALAIAIGFTAAMEAGARYFGYDADVVDRPGLWAQQRRKLETAPDDTIVMIGSSRMLFDMDLAHWEAATGRPVLQLSVVGTSPRMFLEDIVKNTRFSGLVAIGVTPPIFFSYKGGYMEQVLGYYQRESPSERASQVIGVWLEQRLAFLEQDNLPLFELLENRQWPASREGAHDPYWEVWKIQVNTENRDTRLWQRVADDPAYQWKAQQTWVKELLTPAPDAPPPPSADEAINELKPLIEALRARGGDVVFLRLPSVGPFYEAEKAAFPKENYWDRLLAEANAVGVNFEDEPTLQGYVVPEWSHLRADEAERYTRNLLPIIDAKLRAAGKPGILKPEGSK